MIRIYENFHNNLVKILRSGGVAVTPTDTIYGIVGSALLPDMVERIYVLRKRNTKKPMIVLIGSINDLKYFGVTYGLVAKKLMAKVWPGKVSIIFPLPFDKSREYDYLHRGTNQIAFRMPKYPALRRLLKKTGPLVAPSANFEGEPPATTIKEARNYFDPVNPVRTGHGVGVDAYVDGGRLTSKPSTLIRIQHGKIEVLREGAFKIPLNLLAP